MNWNLAELSKNPKQNNDEKYWKKQKQKTTIINLVISCHFHPCASDRNKLALLDVMLNLGEESWVPCLHPLELLGLEIKKQKTKQSNLNWTFLINRNQMNCFMGNYLRASEHKLWVFLHQMDRCHPAAPTFANGLLIGPQPGWLHRVIIIKNGTITRLYVHYLAVYFSFSDKLRPESMWQWPIAWTVCWLCPFCWLKNLWAKLRALE